MDVIIAANFNRLLIVRPDMLVGLSVCRSEETGHIRPEQRQLFASLAAHVRASVRMQLLLEDDLGI